MSLPACETDTTWLGTLNKKQLPPPRAKRKELIRRRPLRGLLLAARPVRALRHRGRKTAWAPRQRAWPGNCGESVPWGGRDALCPFAASGEKHHQLSRALSFRERRPANGRLALQARPLSGKQTASTRPAEPVFLTAKLQCTIAGDGARTCAVFYSCLTHVWFMHPSGAAWPRRVRSFSLSNFMPPSLSFHWTLKFHRAAMSPLPTG
jgi:hypothetical protein